MPSVLHKLLTLALLFTAAGAAAGEQDCHDSVIARDYSRTIVACLELPRADRIAMLDALSRGDYVHHLGTLDRPSQAFSLLRAHASTGDVDAQYVYGTLYGMVHVESPDNWIQAERGTQDRDTYNAMVRAESAVWIKKAADQGHTLAMLDIADYFVQLSYSDPSIDLQVALDYANRAGADNEAVAALVVEKVRRRIDELR